jgi:hypothetical protein
MTQVIWEVKENGHWNWFSTTEYPTDYSLFLLTEEVRCRIQSVLSVRSPFRVSFFFHPEEMQEQVPVPREEDLGIMKSEQANGSPGNIELGG